VRLRHFILGVGAIVACARIAAHLSSESQNAVVVTGDGNFGSVVINTDSASHKLVVAPAPGLQEDEIVSITTNCPDFHINAMGLPQTPNDKGPVVFRHCSLFDYGTSSCVGTVDQTYGFDVVLHPTRLGQYTNCLVTVNLRAGTSRSVIVTGNGIAPPHVAQISPLGPLDFRGVNINPPGNASQPISVRVKNVGSSTLMVTGTLTGTGFTVTGPNPNTINPGAEDVFDLRCKPGSLGTFSGQLEIQTDDPVNGDVKIPLACQGVDSPIDFTVVALDDDPSDNAAVTLVDATPTTIRVTLTNVSAGAVTLGTIVLGSNAHPDLSFAATPPSGALLAISGQVTFDVLWDPKAAFSGDLGDLVVPINGVTDPRLVPVGTSATALVARVSSDQQPEDAPVLDFGPQCIGLTTTRSLQMRSGSDPLDTEYSVTKVNVPAAPFSAELISGSPLVTETSDVQIDVGVHPDSLGPQQQTLDIETDSPTTPHYLVTLAVDALAPGATVSPSELLFEKTVVEGFTNSQTGVFRNCTTNPMVVRDITLDGASAPDFLITGVSTETATFEPPFSLTLAQGESLGIEVQMLPQTDGVKAARLLIGYQEKGADPDTQSIALTGEAFVRDHRDSYYRCSTGTPTRAWPLVVALWLVGRRRRRRR